MSDEEIHPEGSLIMRAGSVQRKAFIIEKGTVEVSKLDENGNKTVLAIRGPNEIIGEMTLLEGGTRCATAIALEECVLRVLTYDKFKRLQNSNPGLQAIKKIMVDRKSK